MRKLIITGMLLCVSLCCASLSLAQKLKQPTQEEIASQAVIDDCMKAFFNAGGRAGLASDTVAEGVEKELRDALSSLKGNKEALENFAKRIKEMAQNGSPELDELLKSKRLRSFAVAVMDEGGSGAFHGLDPDGLKRLVGHGADGLDAAGVRALEILNTVEDAITRTGQLPAELANDLKSALKQLSPEQARAARQLLAEKGARGVIKDYLVKNPTVIGTFVDGAFVLAFDVPGLVALTDAEEKAASATGVGFGYAAQTAGNVASAALGGGFIHGLVVSWSSAQVKELVTEMVMLQYDRENAAMKDQWADMELRLSVIRGMLKVDDLIKAGKLQHAEDYLAKVEQFTYGKKIPNEGLYEKISDLKNNIATAKTQFAANGIIAQARIPYMQGYALADQGRNLTQARHLVEESQAILQEGLGRHPELQDRVRQVQALIAFIDKMIADAPPLGQADVAGPDSVKPGEVAHFEVSLAGGIPDYGPVDMPGHGLTTGALFYWEAPMEPGTRTLTFRVRDNVGKTAEVQKQVEVAGDAEKVEMTGEVWAIMKDTPHLEISFGSGYGNTRKTIQATIAPGTQLSFPVSYTEHEQQYEGKGSLSLSADGQTVTQLSLDLDIVSTDYGLIAKEEIRLGPFREVSLDPKYNLNYEGKVYAYSKEDGLRYVYAVGERETRGTYHYGEHTFGTDESGNIKKNAFAWREVEKIEQSSGSNTWPTFENVTITFKMSQ